MVVLEPTISTYFSAIDVDSVPQLSTMRFLIYDAISTSKCGRDDAGVDPALGLSLRHLFVFTSTTKLKTEKAITSRAGKISIARTNFLPTRFLRHRYVSTLTSIKLQYSRMLLGSIAQLDLITMLCCSHYQRMR